MQGSPEEVEGAMAAIFVWLRYSSARHLTWQRNYNTQPRILGEAQAKLTHKIAEVCFATFCLFACTHISIPSSETGLSLESDQQRNMYVGSTALQQEHFGVGQRCSHSFSAACACFLLPN